MLFNGRVHPHFSEYAAIPINIKYTKYRYAIRVWVYNKYWALALKIGGCVREKRCRFTLRVYIDERDEKELLWNRNMYAVYLSLARQ